MMQYMHHRFSHHNAFITSRGRDTEPRILMDSIRSPNKLHGLFLESTWSPSGVYLESIRTSLKVAATVHYQRILLDSRYTPDRLLMESIRTSLKVAATVHYQRILLDSRYTLDRLLMESIRIHTI